MGLLKYLKDKAIILHCLEQAKNKREDLQHIFNAARHLSQTQSKVLWFSLVRT